MEKEILVILAIILCVLVGSYETIRYRNSPKKWEVIIKDSIWISKKDTKKIEDKMQKAYSSKEYDKEQKTLFLMLSITVIFTVLFVYILYKIINL